VRGKRASTVLKPSGGGDPSLRLPTPLMNVFGMTTSSQETLQLSFLFPPQPLVKDTLPRQCPNPHRLSYKCTCEDFIVTCTHEGLRTGAQERARETLRWLRLWDHRSALGTYQRPVAFFSHAGPRGWQTVETLRRARWGVRRRKNTFRGHLTPVFGLGTERLDPALACAPRLPIRPRLVPVQWHGG
jgi:hypothetical protein